MGKQENNFQYEVPKATLYLENYYINFQFAVGGIPVDCILGNPFLAAVEPHGSARLDDDRSGYFISIPNQQEYLQAIPLPFVSTPRISTMVQAMQELGQTKKMSRRAQGSKVLFED